MAGASRAGSMGAMTTLTPARAFAPVELDRRRASQFGRILAAVAFGAIGIATIALAMAFPLALGVVAEDPGLRVAAADLAVASRAADLWWIVAGIGALHLVALLTVLDRGIWGKRIALVLAGAGAAGAAAAQIALVGSGTVVGDAADFANGAALVYGVIVVAVVLIQPRERTA